MIDKLQEINRILIVRLSSMGDIILTSSLVRQIRKAYPTAIIDFVLANQFAEVYQCNPRINNLFEYDKSHSAKEIKSFKQAILSNYDNKPYDVIIDLQKNHRSNFLTQGLSQNILKVKKNRINKFVLVHFKKPIYRDITPIPELYLHTADPLWIPDDELGLELWLPEENEHTGYLPFVKENKKKEVLNIGLAPGAYHYTKRWMPEAFSELVRQLNDAYKAEFSIFGGADDISIAHKVIESSRIPIKDQSGSLSIIKTAREISKCDLLITNDTGIMHIAAARQVPVIAIFGSTVPEFGFAPYRTPHEIIERKGLPCKPCTHIGRADCPKGHFKCMRLITAVDVFNSCKRMLDRQIQNS